MIEQGIYFALGCIITALFAMGFAPIFWARALRLTRRRLQLQIPVSMQEILADRDLLRAQFAVEQVRIEQALERVQTTKAWDMAEIGRRTVEAATLAEQLGMSRTLAQDRKNEIDGLGRDLAEAGTQIGALTVAMHGEDGLIERLKHRLEDAESEVQRLVGEAHDHRAARASLETRARGLDVRLTESERRGQRLIDEAHDHRAARASLETRNAALDLRLADAESELRRLIDAAHDDRTAAAPLETRNAGLEMRLEDARSEVKRLVDETRDHRIARATLETRNVGLEMRLEDAESQVQRLIVEAHDHRTVRASLETRIMGLEMRFADAERTYVAKEKRDDISGRGVLGAAVDNANRLEASAIALQRERDAAKAQLRALEQEVYAARDREKASHLQRSLQSERAKGAERIHAERLDLLQAENAALREALEKAGSGREAVGNADGELRASIHSLGLAILGMSRETRDDRKAETGPSRRAPGSVPSDADLSV